MLRVLLVTLDVSSTQPFTCETQFSSAQFSEGCFLSHLGEMITEHDLSRVLLLPSLDSKIHFLVVLFCLVSLCSPGPDWPGTTYIYQASLQFTELWMPLFA